jgi:ubiquinone/menaquinone biosynthesis C-methylase UbiE
MMTTNYEPHDLEWTNEKVDRFWNFYNNYKPFDDQWFTKNAGDAVINFAKKYHSISGRVLDYGTGKGFMLEHLINKYKDIELYACDFTSSIPPLINETYKTNSVFKGCAYIKGLPSELNENYFDVVFLVETIEHLNNEYLDATIKEIYRILKPGGIVIITTPHDEDIKKGIVHCADCGAVFHLMQHVRSWNIAGILNQMSSFGFNKVVCKAVVIFNYKDRSGKFYKALNMIKTLLNRPTPKANLVYIGKK